MDKDILLPNLLLKRKMKPKTKLRLMLRPLKSQELLMLPLLMMSLELIKNPRLLPQTPNRHILLKEPPVFLTSMDLSITLMVQLNSQPVESLTASTTLLKAKHPSKMKMVKSMRLSILPELSLIPKIIKRKTN